MPGKRGRPVPMLLFPNWIKAMDMLVASRSQCNVKSRYFFAKPNIEDSHLEAWQVLCILRVTLFFSSYDF